MIPRKIHYIWLGNVLPSIFAELIQRNRQLHSGWEVEIWKESEIAALMRAHYPDELVVFSNPAHSYSKRSDVARIVIVHREGGFYCDTDMVPIRNMEPLRDHSLIIGTHEAGEIQCGIFGAEIGCPQMDAMLRALAQVDWTLRDDFAGGPQLWNRVLVQRDADPRALYCSAEAFYCVSWRNQMDINAWRMPLPQNCFGVHLWAGSWGEIPIHTDTLRVRAHILLGQSTPERILAEEEERTRHYKAAKYRQWLAWKQARDAKERPAVVSFRRESDLPVYRIRPPFIRSQRACDSWSNRNIIDIPAVIPDNPEDIDSRARACSRAHANALRAFLATSESHAVVIEDDIILKNDEWLRFTGFDLFHPFFSNRFSLSVNNTLVEGFRDGFGSTAYIASRAFAKKYVPLLEAGGIADRVDADAAQGMSVAHFAGNAVDHDNDVLSTIDNRRRLWWLDQQRKQAARLKGLCR